MSRVDLKSLKITRQELDLALSTEKRERTRRRLVAMKALLSGKTEEQAAKSAKASVGSVQRWLRWLREVGFSRLVRYPRVGPRIAPMKPDEIRALREEIDAALTRRPNREERKRLLAVDAMLAGGSLQCTATEAKVALITLRNWYAAARKYGAVALLRKVDGH